MYLSVAGFALLVSAFAPRTQDDLLDQAAALEQEDWIALARASWAERAGRLQSRGCSFALHRTHFLLERPEVMHLDVARGSLFYRGNRWAYHMDSQDVTPGVLLEARDYRYWGLFDGMRTRRGYQFNSQSGVQDLDGEILKWPFLVPSRLGFSFYNRMLSDIFAEYHVEGVEVNEDGVLFSLLLPKNGRLEVLCDPSSGWIAHRITLRQAGTEQIQACLDCAPDEHGAWLATDVVLLERRRSGAIASVSSYEIDWDGSVSEAEEVMRLGGGTSDPGSKIQGSRGTASRDAYRQERDVWGGIARREGLKPAPTPWAHGWVVVVVMMLGASGAALLLLRRSRA